MTEDEETAPLEESELIAGIISGYTFEGPSIHLGAALLDGTPYPEAEVRLLLAMMNRHGLVAGAGGRAGPACQPANLSPSLCRRRERSEPSWREGCSERSGGAADVVGRHTALNR
ncbi:hypothetical protein IWX64_000446 [Arthrobacter sp. CAN_A212]